jgi:hypothetical protein
MLLHAGAEITAAVLSAATASASAGADALCQYMASVRSTAATRRDVLIVHAEACNGQSASTTAAPTAADASAAVGTSNAATTVVTDATAVGTSDATAIATSDAADNSCSWYQLQQQQHQQQ